MLQTPHMLSLQQVSIYFQPSCLLVSEAITANSKSKHKTEFPVTIVSRCLDPSFQNYCHQRRDEEGTVRTEASYIGCSTCVQPGGIMQCVYYCLLFFVCYLLFIIYGLLWCPTRVFNICPTRWHNAVWFIIVVVYHLLLIFIVSYLWLLSIFCWSNQVAPQRVVYNCDDKICRRWREP